MRLCESRLELEHVHDRARGYPGIMRSVSFMVMLDIEFRRRAQRQLRTTHLFARRSEELGLASHAIGNFFLAIEPLIWDRAGS